MRPKRLLAGLLASSLAASSVAASENAHHWSYTGVDGPSHWEGTCHNGKLQSPINIRSSEAKAQNLPALSFDYHPSAFQIIDNGHSVQVDLPSAGGFGVGGTHYSLVQFHFHRPSEEEIEGRHFPMVAHLVHRDTGGKLAVVAVPLTSGASSALMAVLWRNLPHQKGHSVTPAGVKIDPSQLIPSNRSYFTYMGSLTTPPCTEGVRWFVLKTPLTISADQISGFAKLYPNDARPVQPTNGRPVLTSR